MNTALQMELNQLTEKPPLGKNRSHLELVWKNPELSHGKHREKSEVELKLVSGLTLYAYVGGNPLSWVDPFGLATVYENPTPTPGVTPHKVGPYGRSWCSVCNDGRSYENDAWGSFSEVNGKEMFDEIRRRTKAQCPGEEVTFAKPGEPKPF